MIERHEAEELGGLAEAVAACKPRDRARREPLSLEDDCATVRDGHRKATDRGRLAEEFSLRRALRDPEPHALAGPGIAAVSASGANGLALREVQRERRGVPLGLGKTVQESAAEASLKRPGRHAAKGT